MKYYFNQAGRSMIEMLGVLAIVGILSVGGIASYSKAMSQYRANKLTEEYAIFIQSMLSFENIIKRDFKNTTNVVNLASIFAGLGIIPSNWKTENIYIYDNSGRQIRPFIRPDASQALVIDYFFRNSSSKLSTKEDKLLCQTLWLNIVQSFKDTIYRTFVYKDGGASYDVYWGNNYCTTGKLCLADITLPEIVSSCSSCIEDSYCVLAIEFK
ncbi:MAG: hypothetical protein NC218_05970 [Acetobacter sp.]|nr:hypothetical protein [Acetobacter sp.]